MNNAKTVKVLRERVIAVEAVLVDLAKFNDPDDTDVFAKWQEEVTALKHAIALGLQAAGVFVGQAGRQPVLDQRQFIGTLDDIWRAASARVDWRRAGDATVNGYDALWQWFGQSYASWLTLPRSFMHEMPDEWQAKMAALLDEYSDTFTSVPDARTVVMLKRKGKFVPMPDFIQYKYPDKATIRSFMRSPK